MSNNASKGALDHLPSFVADAVDTNTADGRLVYNIANSVAQYNREIEQESRFRAEVPTIVGRKIEEIDENSLGMFCDEQCGVTRACHRVRLKSA